MERTKHKKDHSGWYVAYYIRYNLPQFKYGVFDSAEDIIKDKTLHAIMPGDLIVRVNKDQTIITLRYQFSPQFKWVKLNPPVLYSKTNGNWELLNPTLKFNDNGTNQTKINDGDDRSPGRVQKNQATQKKLF